MNTTQLIKANATVINIVSLEKGNVYKRIDETYSTPSVKTGIVTDVLFNGDDAVIQAIELEVTYKNVSTEKKVFTNKTDMRIFPATPEDVSVLFGESIAEMKKAIKKNEEEHKELTKKLGDVENLQSGLVVITSPETKLVISGE